MDEVGGVSHVFLTPFSHIQALVLSTWTDRVASQVKHRKYVSELTNVYAHISQACRHLLALERTLVLQQQVGAFFKNT